MTAIDADDGKLFVSYSHADAPVVHEICGELVARGLSIWVDQNEVTAGDDILDRLNRGLNESKLFIAFVGPSYFRSGRFTSAEFGAAFHKAMGAEGWRVIVVRLQPGVELPPMVAGRLFIEHSTPSETADRILQSVRRAETWDGAVYEARPSLERAAPRRATVDFEDVGDRDLEIIVSAFIEARPRLLRTPERLVSFEVSLPRGRKFEMSLLRAIAENEGLKITVEDLAERINIHQRFVAKFGHQIDEGFLGKFEVAAELALEKQQKKLNDARNELRREMTEMAEEARIVHLRSTSA